MALRLAVMYASMTVGNFASHSGSSGPTTIVVIILMSSRLKDSTDEFVSCAKNHDIERIRAVVKLPRAREKEKGEDTVCSVVHNIFSRDVISEIHTRDIQVSYVTQRPTEPCHSRGPRLPGEVWAVEKRNS